VPYGELLEATRASMAPVRGRPWLVRLVLAAFRVPALMRVVWWGARLVRDSGMAGWLAPRLPQRLGFPLGMLAATAPQRTLGAPATPSSPEPGGDPAVLLTGCVMDGLFGHVHAATRRVLARHGMTCAAPAGQQCCGALHAHAGDLEGARALARTNIAAFEASAPAPIVVNSAGCGAMLKQYGHLLHDDPAWAARAEAVASRTRDLSEVLADRGVQGGTAPVPWRVAHDPPCHQLHAQRVVRPPELLLAAIPGMTRARLEDADQCCGSAGIYTLVEPEVAQVVLDAKLRQVMASGAQVVATGNPGCHMHLGAGMLQRQMPVRVVHPVELLDATWGAPAPRP
jgi:glycolate oxidase iron-sulfur subunit